MDKYKVLKDWEVTDKTLSYFGSHAPGSVLEIEESVAAPLIEEGIIEPITQDQIEADALKQKALAEKEAEEEQKKTVQKPVESAPVEKPKKKFYAGKEIIADGFRTLEGDKRHHIKLIDGSTLDLSEVEYKKITLK